MRYTAEYDSPLGPLTLACDGQALTGAWFRGQKYALAALDPDAVSREDLPVFAQTRRWLDVYFSGRDPGAPPPLEPRGTPFRRRVWAELAAIPYGRTTTYGAIARTLGLASAQAVGGGVGHNPISILLPCHRVVGVDGSLTGYAGGLDKKIALLTLEGVELAALYRPARGTAL